MMCNWVWKAHNTFTIHESTTSYRDTWYWQISCRRHNHPHVALLSTHSTTWLTEPDNLFLSATQFVYQPRFVVYLTALTVIHDSIVSNGWMAKRNKLERMYTEHAWSDCGKPRTSSVRIVGVRARNRTKHLPHVSQKLCCQIQLVRFNISSSSSILLLQLSLLQSIYLCKT
jgi:hypothetical protein